MAKNEILVQVKVIGRGRIICWGRSRRFRLVDRPWDDSRALKRDADGGGVKSTVSITHCVGCLHGHCIPLEQADPGAVGSECPSSIGIDDQRAMAQFDRRSDEGGIAVDSVDMQRVAVGQRVMIVVQHVAALETCAGRFVIGGYRR